MNSIHALGISDRALRIFLEAAGTGSFTDAAGRLGIGQPAVSHAVKTLEDALGVALFLRGRGGIRLTDEGKELERRLSAGFDLVDSAVRDMTLQAQASRTVSLSVSTALATYWLMPRLASFRERHRDVELQVITRDTDRDVGASDTDLWIPLGHGSWAGLSQWVFAEEVLVAVAAPAYAATLSDPDDPRALLDATLLHTEERYTPRFDFAQWFARHGVAVDRPLSGQRSNDYSIVVHAALAGQGVALGWMHIVGPLLEEGRLVTVGGAPVTTDHPFTIVARPGAVRRQGVNHLRRWLLAQAATSVRRIAEISRLLE